MKRLSQVVVAVTVLSLVLAAPIGAARATTTCLVTRLAPVSYTAIDGHTETLRPWQGPKVAVLVEPGGKRIPKVMTKMVCALNRAYTY